MPPNISAMHVTNGFNQFEYQGIAGTPPVLQIILQNQNVPHGVFDIFRQNHARIGCLKNSCLEGGGPDLRFPTKGEGASYKGSNALRCHAPIRKLELPQ